MSGRYGYDDGRSGFGPEREPSEERGQAAWAAQQPATPPPWSSAETQTGQAPPPWALAPTHTGGVLPPTWPPPPPPAKPRARARRVLPVLAATLVLGAGAGAGAWYVTRDHAGGTGAAPATSVSVTVTTTPPQSPTPTPTASASLLTSSSSPSVGYRRAQDPVGYSVDVPKGWTRRQEQGKLARIVYYDAPSDGRQLQIFEVTESTPYDSLTLAETDPGYGFAKQPGYQVVERDHGDTWAELAYRYDDQHKGARQVIDHRFRAADGTLYAIRSSGPANLAPEQVRAPLRMAVGSFCPAGARC